jgi:endonuclease YncB( thermonuclease family)
VPPDCLNHRKPVAAAVAAGFLLFGIHCASAQQTRASCPPVGTRAVQVSRIISGDTFGTETGDEVRLAGIIAPAPDDQPETGARASHALASALDRKTATLAFAGLERDRYGRLAAHVSVEGAWFQEMLVRAGQVRVVASLETGPCIESLFRAEEIARRDEVGYWGVGSFSIISAEDLVADEERFVGTFQIVEGLVRSVGDFRGRYFLNFGED